MNESGRPFSLPTRAEARHAPRLAAPGPVTRRCLVSIHIAWVRRAEEAMRHRPHLACSNVNVPDRRFGRARIDDAGLQHIRTRRGRSRVALTCRQAPHNRKPIASIAFSPLRISLRKENSGDPSTKDVSPPSPSLLEGEGDNRGTFKVVDSIDSTLCQCPNLPFAEILEAEHKGVENSETLRDRSRPIRLKDRSRPQAALCEAAGSSGSSFISSSLETDLSVTATLVRMKSTTFSSKSGARSVAMAIWLLR